MLPDLSWNAFLISTGLISIAEIGDKTMLLAIKLAAAGFAATGVWVLLPG